MNFRGTTCPTAVLQFDECEIFLAQRGDGLERSAIVGIFLRMLDYYEGLLFLTTNRPDTLDYAIRSRVMLRLEYPDLDATIHMAAGAHLFLLFVAMIPELRLGVAVLTNQESSAAFESIVYHVLDHYLNVKAPDYPAAFKTLGDRNRAKLLETGRKQLQAPGSRRTGVRDAAFLSSLALAAATGALVLVLFPVSVYAAVRVLSPVLAMFRALAGTVLAQEARRDAARQFNTARTTQISVVRPGVGPGSSLAGPPPPPIPPVRLAKFRNPHWPVPASRRSRRARPPWRGAPGSARSSHSRRALRPRATPSPPRRPRRSRWRRR